MCITISNRVFFGSSEHFHLSIFLKLKTFFCAFTFNWAFQSEIWPFFSNWSLWPEQQKKYPFILFIDLSKWDRRQTLKRIGWQKYQECLNRKKIEGRRQELVVRNLVGGNIETMSVREILERHQQKKINDQLFHLPPLPYSYLQVPKRPKSKLLRLNPPWLRRPSKT